mgnify:CR=1 FL=1
MPAIKPIHIICDDGVTRSQLNAVIDGINELLQIAQVTDIIEVKNFGVWRHEKWKKGRDLIPHHSVDWYLENAFTGKQNEQGDYQLHTGAIINSFSAEPLQRVLPHYDVLVTTLDLWTGSRDNSWVLGSAQTFTGTVISTYRWRKFSDADQYRFIRTEAEHEFGHVLGLPDINRKDLEFSIGLHCCNDNCVMRQGLNLQQWITHTLERERYGPLCSQCTDDIRWFFRHRD